jgi:beta-phosphoglucomutase family hydrolase
MQALIFDMDGTMVDNMMVHHRAWQRKLAELGLEMTLEEVHQKIHGVNEEILERLFGDRFTPEERRRIAAEKEAAYREIFLPELQLVPGLAEFLEQARAAGIPMAIGTAAPPENARFILDNLQLHDYFGHLVHSRDVTKGKPDPEVFQRAAAGIDVDLRDCLVFEDSPTGSEAVRRGGAEAVIITTTHQPAEFSPQEHIRTFITDFRHLRIERQGNAWSLNH